MQKNCIAPNIYENIHLFEDITKFQKKRDVNHPISAYHEWLKKGHPELTVEQILQLENKSSSANVNQTDNQQNTSSSAYNASGDNDNASNDGDISLSNDEDISSSDDDSDRKTLSNGDNSNIPALPISECYRFFTDMQWCETDVHIITYADIKKHSREHYQRMLPNLFKYADELYATFQANNATFLNDVPIIDRYNFLFHIIAKGQTFYEQCKTNTDFCSFIYFDNLYQTLCSKLLQYFNINNIDELKTLVNYQSGS